MKHSLSRAERVLSIGMVFAFAAVLASAQSNPTAGYGYARALTIDHRQVANTDQTDFPVLISATLPFLATVANGGRVQNANGYDIVFTSDAAGQNQLDHEIDSYNPVTGAAAFWVRIPLLSHTTDTSIYAWYGNSAVVASQENKPGVWRNGYAAVWHFGNSTISALDSTGVNNGTVSGTVSPTTGRVGIAASFNGNSYISIPRETLNKFCLIHKKRS